MTLAKFQWKKWAWPILIGLIIWACTPIRPEGIALNAWYMLAIFVATIVGCITQPLPIAGVTIVGFSLMVLAGITTMDEGAEAFGNNTVWMIVAAYFMSRGFIKTGLGSRIAYLFIKWFGRKTTGLAYSLMAVDFVTAPATPSSTARVGGIVFPIMESLANAFDSHPNDQASSRKLGAYLSFIAFHSDIIAAATFMTAMAPNVLAVSMAGQRGIHISWMEWLIAAIVPAIISIIVIPWLIYKMYPPEIKETPNAKAWAEDQLKTQGKMSTAEKIMAGVFVVALVLWMTSSLTGMDATLVAFLAVSALLVTGVLDVSDILHETGAWSTLIWFSVLIFMANELNKLGLITWLSNAMGSALKGYNWAIVFVIVILFYFYSHYLFASGTAHVTAMYPALLAILLSAGTPGSLAAMALAFTGSIFASTTHYANGPASVLFAAGYVKQSDWWRMNAILGPVYLIIWIGIGGLWMKLIGMW
ncbi:DASS family sodium-coupled anion symporter [Levilactobacillus bambusae]|uniref:Anion permease n=1 Tax=Levilactobacillus bambusae TaxID=2024736 RepID=A0A2V1N0Q8_9LACO|nr:DASS family sodium-coupled anion symporter [Levilactobacillus bambusae]PWG00839.1 anion permease [Levilactobacillus bambusae]